MIARVYRGAKVAGLVRYLYGPGRANEHHDPHLVAAWDLRSPAELATLEPVILSGAGTHAVRDYAPMVSSLELATALREGSVNGRMVWHCPVRVAPNDRTLSDSEWADVARDVMHRTGIAAHGDPGGCRWIAVRHDDVSIHIVAILARQDGRAASTSNDFLRVREACQAAEKKYGLQVTAPADRTAARHTTRAETERAERTGQVIPARDWLRAEVQHAAVAARTPQEFLDRLRAGGVAVKERRDAAGRLDGYAVGRREQGQETVFFGGGKLAADLSLPRLMHRWDAAGDPQAAGDAQPAGDVLVDQTDRRDLWMRATEAAGQAAEIVREQGAGDPDSAGDAAAAAAEILAAASRLVEGQDGGPLSRAARDYDRAARETYGRTPDRSEAGMLLRAAAIAMTRAAGHSPRQHEAAHVALLVAQITSLSLSIARLREAQGRLAQAQAARRAVAQLNTSTDQWSDTAEAFLTARQAPAATAPVAGPGRTAPVLTPPAPQRPAPGRGPATPPSTGGRRR